MAVYLLHYIKPLERSGTRGVRHYLGYATERTVLNRIREHEKGTSGAVLPTELHKRHSTAVWVRLWPGAGRDFERYLKHNGHYSRLCPLCREVELHHTRKKQWARRHKPTP